MIIITMIVINKNGNIEYSSTYDFDNNYNYFKCHNDCD